MTPFLGGEGGWPSILWVKSSKIWIIWVLGICTVYIYIYILIIRTIWVWLASWVGFCKSDINPGNRAWKTNRRLDCKRSVFNQSPIKSQPMGHQNSTLYNMYIYICTYRVNICVYIYLLYIKLYIYICIIACRSVPWNQSKSMWFGNFQLSPIHRSTKINKHPGHVLCTFLVATILVASLIHSASGGFSGDEIEHRITEKLRKKHTSWG